MKWNRGPRNKLTCHLILHKGAKTYIGEETASLTNGAWKIAYPHVEV
jgi:hypothetical protein